MKMQKVDNTQPYSLSKHLAWFTDRNANHVYTAICKCTSCAKKNWVKIPTRQIAPFASGYMGLPDMITLDEFNNVIHTIVQLKG
jgi:hypothetical protein